MSNIMNDIEMCTSSRKSEVSHQERKRQKMYFRHVFKNKENMIIAYKLIAILCIVNLLHPDCFEIYNNNAIPFDIICNIVMMSFYKQQLLYDLYFSTWYKMIMQNVNDGFFRFEIYCEFLIFMIVLNFAIPLFGIKSIEYKIASTYFLL